MGTPSHVPSRQLYVLWYAQGSVLCDASSSPVTFHEPFMRSPRAKVESRNRHKEGRVLTASPHGEGLSSRPVPLVCRADCRPCHGPEAQGLAAAGA